MFKRINFWLALLAGLGAMLLLAYAIYACPDKTPEWISAFAAVVSAFGVLVVWQQLQETGEIARLQFEDGLAKEYRELIGRIPTKAMLGEDLSPGEFDATFDELFRYIDLSNEQVMLRKNKRISVEVWSNWRDGISSNFELPAFQKAWKTVQLKIPSQFSELKRLFEELEKLLIRPEDVSISVLVEPVETLRQAQGERFIVNKAGTVEDKTDPANWDKK